MTMQSINFEPLRDVRPDLVELAAFAERYVHTDPSSAMVKMRNFVERMVEDIFRKAKLPRPDQASLFDLLQEDSFKSFTPTVVLEKLHAIRKHGNKAAHGQAVPAKTAAWLLKECHDLARWLHVGLYRKSLESWPAYQEPKTDEDVDTLRQERSELIAQLAAQEAETQRVLAALDAERERIEAAAGEDGKVDASLYGQAAASAASELEFDEQTTRRRLIDSLLIDAGWDVAGGGADTAEVGQEVDVPHQPTETGMGRADYLLWDDNGLPLAVIEAKRTAKSSELGRKQAALYADGLQKQHGQRPMIFYTNGIDIWLWDDVQGYAPRRVLGFYSKDSLQYLVNFQRDYRKSLDTIPPNAKIAGRLYQIEALRRVAERFTAGHQKALVVQATGTGKTRVAIALAEMLIRAGWVRRVLFLCDRRELRKQAYNAFQNHVSEPMTLVRASTADDKDKRIYIGTYPAMKRIFESFDVGFFDLIVADESHRSIYNVYGDIFRYFDCLQVGLTATPVDFVSHNTFSLFGCEDDVPTFNYDLEQAVADEWLVPPEVFEHTTHFLREGIKYAQLSAEQRQRLEDEGENPQLFEYEQRQVDKQIFNKDTNRAILRNLMENGIRDATGQTVGKTIVFARNHNHAVLLRELFDELYPQYGGRFCQVIDNYDPRAEQLIDDFKGEGNNDDLTIAISVDMLDTGIDVPEVVNLVFAKPVMSKVKFWQMIGRGTRLCPNLFGPGQDKQNFRIFDHWGNFAYFDERYRPAEPTRTKSLMQRVFEARIELAEEAMNRAETELFHQTLDLIAKDIAALPEDSIPVREKWRQKREAAKAVEERQFDPALVALLKSDVATLMRWRDIRGSRDAYEFDLLLTDMQVEKLRGSAKFDDLKVEAIAGIQELQMHLNPVQAKATVIKETRQAGFWDDASVGDLERIRKELRGIMQHRRKRQVTAPTPKVVDIKEDEAQIETRRRVTNLRAVDLRAYQVLVQQELEKLFDTDPTLRKIRRQEPVTQHDLDNLIGLVLVQNPDVDLSVLSEFYPEAGALDAIIRSLVGMEPEAVEARFADFSARHPGLKAKQMRFLGLLKTHIARHGAIEVERLYEDPFTAIDGEGLDGVFDDSSADELVEVVKTFLAPALQEEKDERPQ